MQTYITQQWQHTSVLEIIAVLLGVVQVLLAYKNNKYNYLAGIISTGIFIWIFSIKSGLYADASLNLYYLIMSIYGWVIWSRNSGAQQSTTPISRCNKRERLIALGIVLLSFIGIYFILRNLTDSTVPLYDAAVAAFAWSGMWLMAKRKIENWIFLNISNIIAIPLYFYKHLPLTALLTIFLFVVAILGYLHWQKLLLEEENTK